MNCHTVFFATLLLSVDGANFKANLAVKLAKNYVAQILKAGGENKCTSDLNRTMYEALEFKLWALELLDASAKLPSGMLAGNMVNMGAFDQCIKIAAPFDVRGKYCEAILNGVPERPGQEFSLSPKKIKQLLGFHARLAPEFEARFPMTTALCVPASCKAKELQAIADFADEKFNLRLYLRFDDALCFTDDSPPYTVGAVLTIFFFLAVAVLMVVGTVYDVQTYGQAEEARSEFLLAFSMYTNGKRLFSLHREDENLAAINGIRTITMAWVVLGHTFMFRMFRPATNRLIFKEWTDSLRHWFLTSAPLSVNTFFTISGFLVVYVYHMHIVNKGRQVSWGTFYLHRILRLSPSLIALVLFYHNIFRYIGSGPLWYTIERKYEHYCKKYWWSTLMFVQNYWNTNEECVRHSWYIAVDTQLYFLAPILLVGLKKYRLKTLVGAGTLVFCSALTAYLVTNIKQLGFLPSEATDDYFSYIYCPTHIRMVSWLIGALWGYLLYRKFKMTASSVRITWTICLPTMLLAMCLATILFRYDYDSNVAGLYNALVPPIWAACVGWVIFACAKGYAGPINDFLSSPFFNLTARLSYSTYLLHMPLMIFYNYQTRVSDFFTDTHTYFEFVCFYTMTFFIAVPWTLAFEAPIRALEKYMIRKYGGAQKDYRLFDKSLSEEKIV